MARPTKERSWVGRAVKFVSKGLAGMLDPHDYELGMTEDTARKLALALAHYRTLTSDRSMPPEVQEILHALNYVLVGDPHSRTEFQRMEAGKGMTPDGGHKAPEVVADHHFRPRVSPVGLGPLRCGYGEESSSPCVLPQAQHPPLNTCGN